MNAATCDVTAPNKSTCVDDDLRDQKGKDSLIDLIASTVHSRADDPFATWYDGKGKISDERTFGLLWEEAGTIATYLLNDWNVEKGQRVVLCYAPGFHFFAVFLGCLRAGVTAVLVYPPAPPLTKSLPKMMKVVDDCSPVLILLDSRVKLLYDMDKMKKRSKSRGLWPKGIDFKVTDKLSKKKKQHLDVEIQSSDIAFLQYTSGSTGDPKGVMVSFGALKANVDVIHDTFYASGVTASQIIGFSWLPPYHDAGLIFAAIAPFVGGWRAHMMSPLDFLKNPLLWMKLISKHRITWALGPDFAYNLVARRFREAKVTRSGQSPIHGLDLSHVNLFLSCAEPVRVETRESFDDVFREHGLPTNWFAAGYGLAENVVAVSYLHGFHLSVPRDEDLKPLVAVGSQQTFHPSLDVKIVCPKALTEMPNNTTGEIWLSGSSVAMGYYGKPELTKSTFHAKMVGSEADFLRTGDLAFFQDDKLFICGRIKDLIITNGVNYYPQDIELAAQDSSRSVRPGCIAAFSSNETDEDGSLEIVFEIRADSARRASEVCSIVKESVIQKTGLVPSRIVAIEERSINKTTSGKIQRRATRNALKNGNLCIVYDWQNSNRNMHTEFPQNVRVDQNRCMKDGKGGSTHNTFDQFEEILTNLFGRGFDSEKNWDELGLSSLLSVKLIEDIAESMLVTLPINVFELCQTPAALKLHILNIQERRCALPIKTASLPDLGGMKLSWLGLGVLQVFGMAILLLMFTICMIPAWYVGNWLSVDETVEVFQVNGRYVKWQWFPLTIPAWMFSFSLIVIVAKWIVIGRYRVCEMPITSLGFVRWWFIDRAVHLWEQWVGFFLTGTPFVWLFYKMMGAKIHISVRIDTFLREFDLIQVDEGTSLDESCTIKCRLFTPGPAQSIHFQPVHVESHCSIGGMLCPGVNVGSRSKVTIRAVLREGMQVPDNSVVLGNPATRAEARNNDLPLLAPWWKVYGLSLMWGIFTLYLTFSLNLVAQCALNNRFPSKFRYSELCYWVLIIFLTAILILPVNIAMKWLLIGRRLAGCYEVTAWKNSCDWVIDFHFKIACWLIAVPWKSWCPFWNLVLHLYGLDIDNKSRLGSPMSLTPTKVDLIRIRRSYVSSARVNFKTSDGNKHDEIELNDSSVGALTVLGPGINVSNAIIPPTEFITYDVIGDDIQQPYQYTPAENIAFYFWNSLWMLVIICSFIPSYEFCVWSFSSTTPELAALSISVALALHVMLSCLILVAIECTVFPKKGLSSPWNIPLFDLCIWCASLVIQHSTFLPILWGSPIWNMMVRAAGGSVGKRVLFFGDHQEGFLNQTLLDDTIIDGAVIIGHNAVGSSHVVGPVVASGVLHEGTFLFENTRTSESNTGPWRCAPAVSFTQSNPPSKREESHAMAGAHSEGSTVQNLMFLTNSLSSQELGSNHSGEVQETSLM